MRTRVRDLTSRTTALVAAALLLAAPATAQEGSSALPLVVIDAGHGGVDPGARGPGGTREKDVTLAVARRLADELRARSVLARPPSASMSG